MVMSMTGYGRGEKADDAYEFIVEIRSFNHRFSDIKYRAPREFLQWEPPVRSRIGEAIHRGRVEVNVTAQPAPGASRLELNAPVARGYYAALQQLQRELGLDGPIAAETIASLPEVFTLHGPPGPDQKTWPAFEAAFSRALSGLLAMRRREGQALAEDFRRRLRRLEGLLESVREGAPGTVEAYRARLGERLKHLPPEVTVDPQRVAAEVAMFAERISITEEIVRLGSHLQQMEETLDGGGAAGRKLEFLIQEAVREVNTIGSKAQDGAAAGLIVNMKTELENLREQAQNIE